MSKVCYSPLGRLVDWSIQGTSRWTRPLVMSEETDFQTMANPTHTWWHVMGPLSRPLNWKPDLYTRTAHEAKWWPMAMTCTSPTCRQQIGYPVLLQRHFGCLTFYELCMPMNSPQSENNKDNNKEKLFFVRHILQSNSWNISRKWISLC